jgi:N-ethylmaleimide reductase
MQDSNPKATFSYVIDALNQFDLAYIHLMEPNETDIASGDVLNPVLPIFRPVYKGRIITNGSYDKSKGNSVLSTDDAHLVSFGKLFIANPDLPERFAVDAQLNVPNPKTFYGLGDKDLDKGYTDYPFLELQQA